MARTIKIKKKTLRNKKTHTSNISGKHLSKSYEDSRISKKYKSLINNRKTNRAIRNIRTKKENDILHGGFLGLDYLKLKWKLMKFNNIISKLNSFDKSIQKDIDTYKIQAKEFEERAKEKAELQTQFIDSYREKVMFEIYREDPKEAPKTNESKSLVITNSIKTLDNRMISVGKRISELDKQIGNYMPEYNRLMKIFKIKESKFNQITNKFANISDFYQQIKDLKRVYDDVAGKNKNTVSKAYRKKAKQYEKHKADYDRVLNLTDMEIQNRTKIKQELSDLLISSEYYRDQFGTYKGKSKKSQGALDIALKEINCSGGSGLLCKWTEEYKKFAKELLLVDTMADNILKKILDLKKSAEICVKNLSTVFESYKKDPQPQAMLRFETDVIDFIEIIKLAQTSISKLKAEFYRQTPASRIMIDYNELTVEFNYARIKFKVYIEQFNPDITMPQELKGGSYNYIISGGAGHTGRVPGGRTARSPRQQPNNCSNILQRDNPLTNDKFYKKEMRHFRTYTEVYNDFKKHNLDCFKDLDNFKIIFNNYYSTWLFFTNTTTNLNTTTLTNPTHDTIIQSLKYFIVINNILDNTIKINDPADSTKWVWKIDLMKFIVDIFKNKITNFTIPPELSIATFQDKTLVQIFVENPPTDTNMTTIRGNPSYTHVMDMVEKVHNHTLPNTGGNNFFGVKEWDAIAGTPNVFNDYLTSLAGSVSDFNDKNVYPDKTAPQTQAQGAQLQLTQPSLQNIDEQMKTIKTLKSNIDSVSFPFQNEYYDFLKQLNDGFQKQKEKGIIAANQSEINNIISDLEKDINGFVTLDPQDIDKYKRDISLYTGWYLQPLLNIFDIVKTRGHGEDVSRKAAEEVRKLIEKGERGDIAVDAVLKLDEFKAKTVSPIVAVPGAAVTPPPNVNPGAAVGAPAATTTTLGAATIITPGADTNSADKKVADAQKNLEEQLKKNVNLIAGVVKRVHAMGNFPLQSENIAAEYKKIYKTLNDASSLIKELSNKLQGITRILLELKYIEPRIVGVSVKDDKSIRLTEADWIVKGADKNFQNLQKLSITNELQERRKKNRDIYTIHMAETYADDSDINDLYNHIAPFAGDKNEIRKRIATNPDYITKLSNPNNLQRIISIIITNLKPADPESKKKGCNMLTELSTVVGVLDETRRKVMNDAMISYDPNAALESRAPCYFKEKDRDKDKDKGKDGKGKVRDK